jgi:hypothetical protein
VKKIPLLITLAVVATSCGVAYAGDLTMPLGTTGSSTSAPALNSFFDHDGTLGCSLSGGCNSSLTTWTGSVLAPPSYNVSLSGCTRGTSCYDGHDGIDFEATSGTPVYAAMTGTITAAGDSGDGFGNKVKIWNSASGYTVLNGHLSSVSVSAGTVYRGQLIGYSGNTGCSSYGCGAHLHFGVYNAQTGGSQMDPYGWSGSYSTNNASDPYTPDVGYLWGSRTGFISSGGAVNVREPYLASINTQLVSNSASSFAVGDSRVGYIQSGSAWVKDGELGGSWHQIWNAGSGNGNANKLLLAGRRIVILTTTGAVWAKDGPWDASWYGNTSIATGVSSVYTSKNWTTILFSNQELYIKAGLGDGWFDLAGGVTSAALSRYRVVALFYDGSVYAKEGGFGSGNGWTPLDSGANAISAGGGRICDIRSSNTTAYCKEANLNDTWTTTYSGASLVRASDARIAVKDSSSGYLKVLEGSISAGASNSGWITVSNNGNDSDIQVN